MTIAQHATRLGDLEDLVQSMRDEHNCSTGLCYLSADPKNRGGLRAVESRRRLIQDQDVGVT